MSAVTIFASQSARRGGRVRGFSLIEMMIVISIIGILGAIAYPQYTEYVRKGKISEALNALSEMRIRMEREFQDYRTYEFACAPGRQAPMPEPTPGGFSFSCVLGTSTFEVHATGSGDLSGLEYAINQQNIRTTVSVPVGWTAPTGNCWVKDKSGRC